jgi:DNA ligase-1
MAAMGLFADAARLAEYLAGEPGRLKKRAAIAEAIAAAHAVAPESSDAGLLALYIAGSPFAESDPRKLNAGGALLSKALKAVSGANDAALTAAYRRHGDMGSAGFDLLAGKSPEAATLTLAEVAEAFAAMAAAKTTAMRAALVEALLRRATALEAKYLLKLMLGDMRIGVKQSLVEEAIAAAASVAVGDVRNAVMLEADLGATVAMAFHGRLGGARMRLFHPLGFMLASPVETPEEAVERFTAKVTGSAKKDKAGPLDSVQPIHAMEPHGCGTRPVVAKEKTAALDVLHPTPAMEAHGWGTQSEEEAQPAAPAVEAFLEDKYDGMRAQIHCGESDRVAIYSRNREEITESFPELAEAFSSVASGLIFDGEILGWDFDTGQALPFAVMGQRIGRKQVSSQTMQQIPVVFMAFDLLYARGELLLDRPLKDRRNLLEAAVEELGPLATVPIPLDERRIAAQGTLFGLGTPAPEAARMPRLMLSPSRLVESAEEIDRAYAAARARANEGVMLKAANSIYQPGRRGLAWVKLKRELATLDVVITGAEFGHGRRAGILSDYTFAVRGPEFHQTGELLNVGKAYSGLTDIEIAELSAWAMAHTLEDTGHFRTVEPIRILEVAFNNIMRSGRHASGFALRFPRILRIRDDKPLEEIDTLDRVEEIYQSQVDKPVDQSSNAGR